PLPATRHAGGARRAATRRRFFGVLLAWHHPAFFISIYYRKTIINCRINVNGQNADAALIITSSRVKAARSACAADRRRRIRAGARGRDWRTRFAQACALSARDSRDHG